MPLTYRRARGSCRSLTGGLADRAVHLPEGSRIVPFTYRRAGAYADHGWHALDFQIENRLSTIENPSSPEETPV